MLTVSPSGANVDGRRMRNKWWLSSNGTWQRENQLLTLRKSTIRQLRLSCFSQTLCWSPGAAFISPLPLTTTTSLTTTTTSKCRPYVSSFSTLAWVLQWRCHSATLPCCKSHHYNLPACLLTKNLSPSTCSQWDIVAGDATLGSPLTSTKIVKAEFCFSCTTSTRLQAHLLSSKLSLVPPLTLLPSRNQGCCCRHGGWQAVQYTVLAIVWINSFFCMLNWRWLVGDLKWLRNTKIWLQIYPESNARAAPRLTSIDYKLVKF